MLLLLDDEKGGWPKNPINQGFFCSATLFLRGGNGGKEQRGQRSKKTPPFLHKMFWGLKSVQVVVPPFSAPNCHVLNSAKALFLKHFQEKLVVAIFFEKAMLEMGTKQTKKNQ